MNDSMTIPLLVFAAVLFTAGLVGFLTRRSLILMFLSLELMLAGASVNFITFSSHFGNYQGQVFVIMVLTVAACEASIALAIVTLLYRRKATLDVMAWSDLSETLDQQPPEKPETMTSPTLEFPTLTPAGLDPMLDRVPSEYKAEVGVVLPIHDTKETKHSKEATHV
jgi:NADH-quinone oxidoreductase subunit K